jgi:hypothetical protein
LSIFSQPTRPTTDILLGTVLAVDPNTKTCHVKTYLGQLFRNAKWLVPTSGSQRDYISSAPSLGSQVLVHMSTGVPIILGCIPMAQTSDIAPMVSNLTGGAFTPVEFTNLNGILPTGTSHAPSCSSDTLPSDHVLQTPGGTLLGVLQHSVMLRAGAQSQILVSKLDDLVRVVGRNWDHFCDAKTEVSANFRGRGYNFKGAALSVSDQKYSYYNYYEALGDVVAAETLQENSYGQPASAVPAANEVIHKEVVQSWSGGTPTVLAKKEWHANDGTIQWNVGGTSGITITWAASGWSVEDPSSNAYVNLVSGQFLNAAYATSQVQLSDSQAVMVSNGSQVTLTSSEAQMSSNGHAVTVTSGGVNIT